MTIIKFYDKRNNHDFEVIYFHFSDGKISKDQSYSVCKRQLEGGGGQMTTIFYHLAYLWVSHQMKKKFLAMTKSLEIYCSQMVKIGNSLT